MKQPLRETLKRIGGGHLLTEKVDDLKDKDIDNDGDTDDSDKYLHHKLGTVAKKTESTKPKKLSDISGGVVGIPALGDILKGK